MSIKSITVLSGYGKNKQGDKADSALLQIRIEGLLIG